MKSSFEIWKTMGFSLFQDLALFWMVIAGFNFDIVKIIWSYLHDTLPVGLRFLPFVIEGQTCGFDFGADPVIRIFHNLSRVKHVYFVIYFNDFDPVIE